MECDKPITVDIATADATAQAGKDYTAVKTTITFAPGQTMQTISVPILDDGIAEANETFVLHLSNPSGAAISNSRGVATIADDDTKEKGNPASRK